MTMENMNKKEKILMILPRKLFPLVSGYSLKNYYLIQILAKEYDISLYLLSRDEISGDEQEFYKKYVRELHVHPLNAVERLTGILSAALKGLPLQTGLYFSKKVEKEICGQADKDYKLIVCELVRTMSYSRKLGIPTVFDMVDSIGLNYQESQEKTSSPMLRAYYKFETKRLLKYEKQCIQKANITFLFNQKEKEYWDKFGNVRLLPHGVREELLNYEEDETAYKEVCDQFKLPQNYIAFIGKMNYQPNVDAVSWYVEQVHSRLKNAPHLVILGAYPTDYVRQLADQYENITVTGYMDDPYLILKNAFAVIAPMQTGGGIQNKVLEAMALGKVNLISSKAAGPIVSAADGRDLLVCDTPEQYEHAYEKMKADPDYCDQIGRNAKEFIHAHFTWEQYGKMYLNELRQVKKG